METIPNITSAWLWVGFFIFLIVALSIDTFLLKTNNAAPHRSIRASLIWTGIWIGSALVFNALLWLYLLYTMDATIANQKALEFFTGYLIEKSLSVDNLFAFYMIFHQFHIPVIYQHRIFTIGIWSAIVLRLMLILFGVWLVSKFHWFLYLMGIFLLLTGVKMLFLKEKEKDLSDSVTVKLLKRLFRFTTDIEGHHFFIKKNHLIYATPLFVALVFIEMSDLIFAFDSIPAIFAITRDPFLVWSSNIFAILGLRALYFVLADMVRRFHLLKQGVALILVFVGMKMLIEPWIHIPVLVSLGVIASLLILFAGLSMRQRNNQGK